MWGGILRERSDHFDDCPKFRLCFWILEQPKGSMMELHPMFQEFMNKIYTWKHSILMKDYGAPSQKPTWLYARPMHLLILERRRAVPGFNDNNPTKKTYSTRLVENRTIEVFMLFAFFQAHKFESLVISLFGSFPKQLCTKNHLQNEVTSLWKRSGNSNQDGFQKSSQPKWLLSTKMQMGL